MGNSARNFKFSSCEKLSSVTVLPKYKVRLYLIDKEHCLKKCEVLHIGT